jgi:hypothetical protein
MIINQDDNLVVPNNTVAIFPLIPHEGLKPFDMNFNKFLRPLNNDHKRNWFYPHFYRCLPLAIGNMQGFVFTIPYGFDVMWNGGNGIEDIAIQYHSDFDQYAGTNYVTLSSEFGHGILTIHAPITLKTPPGVNLMTIAPPNFPIPGMSPMTGVVESDNIRFTFTLNIKLDIPNVRITVAPETALIGLLPIPRYFCDSFKLVSALDLFDKEVIDEEKQVVLENTNIRTSAIYNKDKPDRMYYRGMDVRGNKFKDHQLPKEPGKKS